MVADQEQTTAPLDEVLDAGELVLRIGTAGRLEDEYVDPSQRGA